VTVVLIVVALVYTRGWRRLRPAPANNVHVWRLAAFLSGLCVVWIAAVSPLAMLHHASLTIHMMQHLLLMVVAAPLMLLGAPGAALLRGFPVFVQRALDATGRIRFFRHLWCVLTPPVCSWLAGTGAVIGWHVPAAFALGMQSHGWHHVQQASFVAAGLLFWWPVVRTRRTGAMSQEWFLPAYLFAATLPCDALSAFLVVCDRVVYRSYTSGPSLFGMTSLQDQAYAGALMWVSVTFVYLIPAVIVTMQLLSPTVTDSQGLSRSEGRSIGLVSAGGFEIEGV